MARIAIVTNSLSGGGAERAMNILANELHRLNHEVTVFAINNAEPDAISLTCSVVEIGRPWRGSVLDTIKSWMIFQEKIREIQPNIVILNCDLPEFYGALTPMRANLVAVEHVNYPWRNRELFGRLIRFILKIRGTKWVAVSDHLGIWPSNNSPHKVIFNPISEIGTSESRSAAPIKRLVFIGRLTFQKNPDLIIQAANRVQLPVLALGDGEDGLRLFELAKELKVNFSAPGFSTYPWREISDGDLLVIPSRYEGDGLVVIEALQRNIPFILSDIPEFRRFGLPNLNYASGVDEFAEAIIAHQQSTAAFQVSSGIADSILSVRKIEFIGNDWEKFIVELLDCPEK
jgi:glycosyltransferase involved in cell wall biosynthesis